MGQCADIHCCRNMIKVMHKDAQNAPFQACIENLSPRESHLIRPESLILAGFALLLIVMSVTWKRRRLVTKQPAKKKFPVRSNRDDGILSMNFA